MTPIWVIVVAMCLVEDGRTVSCKADAGTKAFTSEVECKIYAKVNYNPVPDCIQPLTVFYEKEKKQ